jgi:hypothetical protein
MPNTNYNLYRILKFIEEFGPVKKSVIEEIMGVTVHNAHKYCIDVGGIYVTLQLHHKFQPESILNSTDRTIKFVHDNPGSTTTVVLAQFKTSPYTIIRARQDIYSITEGRTRWYCDPDYCMFEHEPEI